MKEYHFIINTHAGNGNGAKVATRILALMNKHHYPYTAYYTEYPQQEADFAKQLAADHLRAWDDSEDFPLLIVLGGDGTLHQVLNALTPIDPMIPVGYIPCGSGNDFSRGVGIAREPEQAFWQIIKAQTPQQINVIQYNEKIQDEQGLVVNNVGIGLDAAVVAATNDSLAKKNLNKYQLGSLSYLVSLVKILFTQKGFPIMVEINGQTLSYKNAFLCTTTNHPYFGGGVPIVPVADPRKNNLDLVIVERIAFFKIAYLIVRLLQKKHLKSKYVHHFQSSKLHIVSTVPQYGQADGEVMGQRPFDIYFTTAKRMIWF